LLVAVTEVDERGGTGTVNALFQIILPGSCLG
jgi:hypothetical protein